MNTDRHYETTPSRAAGRLIKRVERIMAGEPVDWIKLMRLVPVGDEWELMKWAERRLAALPLQDSAEPTDDLMTERRALERFSAELFAWEGNPEPLIGLLQQDFLERGELDTLLIDLLIDLDREMEAWVLAKYALSEGVRDKQKVRTLQSHLARIEATWT